jgi:hypothetical protein
MTSEKQNNSPLKGQNSGSKFVTLLPVMVTAIGKLRNFAGGLNP